MNREEQPRNDRRHDRRLYVRPYETRPGIWIAGAAVGLLLSFGMVLAAERYVRVANDDSSEATAVAPRAQPARVAEHRDRFNVGDGCEFDVALCRRKCSVC